jgi:HTH-type transcriptional regulator, competence development regulator
MTIERFRPTVGALLRERRESLRERDRRYSVRQVASRVGIEPSYLSKVERDEVAPPSEETLVRLATELELDADVLLAMAGKVSSDLLDVIRRRPLLFAELIRELKDMPDHSVLRLVREVRDGEW